MHYDTGRYAGHDTPICMKCKHRTEIGRLDNTGWKCKAFPEGIPQEILTQELDHTKPIEGDHGFLYESKVYADHEGKYTISWDGDFQEVDA
jgi:hypothetical protein